MSRRVNAQRAVSALKGKVFDVGAARLRELQAVEPEEDRERGVGVIEAPISSPLSSAMSHPSALAQNRASRTGSVASKVRLMSRVVIAPLSVVLHELHVHAARLFQERRVHAREC